MLCCYAMSVTPVTPGPSHSKFAFAQFVLCQMPTSSLTDLRDTEPSVRLSDSQPSISLNWCMPWC